MVPDNILLSHKIFSIHHQVHQINRSCVSFSDIDDCVSGPCQHGGSCTDGINMVTCDCTGTGYTGSYCEISMYLNTCYIIQTSLQWYTRYK